MSKLPSPLHEWVMAVPLWIPLSLALIFGTITMSILFGFALEDLRRK